MAFAGRLVTAEVDRDVRGRERASDHAPVWIELAERKAGHRGAGASATPEWRNGPPEQPPLSSETGFFGKRLKKERSEGAVAISRTARAIPVR